jgi:hypothetical protein
LLAEAAELDADCFFSAGELQPVKNRTHNSAPKSTLFCKLQCIASSLLPKSSDRVS